MEPFWCRIVFSGCDTFLAKPPCWLLLYDYFEAKPLIDCQRNVNFW